MRFDTATSSKRMGVNKCVGMLCCECCWREGVILASARINNVSGATAAATLVAIGQSGLNDCRHPETALPFTA